MLEGERPVVYGSGQISRDFTHVENIVQANLTAADAEAAAGRVMNIAAGQSHTLNELFETLRRLLDVDVEADYAESRLGDVAESLAEISLARELLGYEPRVGFEDGLVRTIRWIAEQSGSYADAVPGPPA